MVKSILLAGAVVTAIVFSGCSATKAEVKKEVDNKKSELKQEVKKAQTKAISENKAKVSTEIKKLQGTASTVKASDFFKE